jgi:hypothetical protein
MRWAWQSACVRDKKGINILFGKPAGKRKLGIHRRKWEDN